MNPRIAELDREIEWRTAREAEIEEALRHLRPARAKTDEPIKVEDYTGAVGEAKNRRLDELTAEKSTVRQAIRALRVEQDRLMNSVKGE